VLSSYKKPYTKALGKDAILVCHEQKLMHQNAAEKADSLIIAPNLRVDSQLAKLRQGQEEENKEFLHTLSIVWSF